MQYVFQFQATVDCKNSFHSAYGNNGSEQAKRTYYSGLKYEQKGEFFSDC